MGISPSAQFIWTYVTTAITLCCRTKQQGRDCLRFRELVFTWFYLNPGTVLSNDSTKDQTQQPWYVLPGNKHQKITCECGQYSLEPFCVAVSVLSCFAFSFIQSQYCTIYILLILHCFCVWCPTSGKCVNLTKCQWGILPCYCTKLTYNLFCCCCHCHDYDAKRNHDHDQQRMR